MVFSEGADGQWLLQIGRQSTGWRFLSIHNFLATLHLRGVGLLHTMNLQESITLVVGLHQLLEKEEISGAVPFVRTIRPALPVRADIGALAAVPGIGEKTAVLLLRHFKDIASIIAADDKDFETVKGIGPIGVKNLRLTFGRYNGGRES